MRRRGSPSCWPAIHLLLCDEFRSHSESYSASRAREAAQLLVLYGVHQKCGHHLELMSSPTGDHSKQGLPQDHQIERKRPVFHVSQIEAQGVLSAEIRAAADLPQAG
jgi:hypothetical protein